MAEVAVQCSACGRGGQGRWVDGASGRVRLSACQSVMLCEARGLRAWGKLSGLWCLSVPAKGHQEADVSGRQSGWEPGWLGAPASDPPAKPARWLLAAASGNVGYGRCQASAGQPEYRARAAWPPGRLAAWPPGLHRLSHVLRRPQSWGKDRESGRAKVSCTLAAAEGRRLSIQRSKNAAANFLMFQFTELGWLHKAQRCTRGSLPLVSPSCPTLDIVRAWPRHSCNHGLSDWQRRGLLAPLDPISRAEWWWLVQAMYYLRRSLLAESGCLAEVLAMLAMLAM